MTSIHGLNSEVSPVCKSVAVARPDTPEIIDIPTAAELATSIDDLVANISTIKSVGSGASTEDTSFLD